MGWTHPLSLAGTTILVCDGHSRSNPQWSAGVADFKSLLWVNLIYPISSLTATF